MNFGQEMAQMRRQEKNKLYDRLTNAIKRNSEKPTWTLQLDEQIIAAIRTITSLGMTAEIQIKDGKPTLLAVKYERA